MLKSILKKVISLMLVSLIIFSALPAHAHLHDNEARLFVSDFADLYYAADKTCVYSMLNYNGEDITKQFISDTYFWFLSNQFEKVYDYYLENVQKMVKQQISISNDDNCFIFGKQDGSFRAIDITKTETLTFEINCKWDGTCNPYYVGIANGNNNGKLRYCVRGSISYNPNTYIVSSIGTPVRITGVRQVGSWRTELAPYITAESYSKGSTGALSGSFNYYVTIEAYFMVADAPVSVLSYGTYRSIGVIYAS